MTWMQRIRIFLLAIVLSSVYLPSVLFAEKVQLELWHGMGSSQGAALNDIVDRFNSSQETYEVLPIYQGRYNSLSQKLIASCYARRNPAISQLYPGWTTRFYLYGYLTPVEELMQNDPEFTADVLADYYPVMIEENRMTHPTSKKHEIVTLPFNKSVYVLYVNQTLMEEKGWKEPPKTWEELRQLAKEMTLTPEGANKPTRYGFATRPYIEDFTVQAFSAGINLLDEDTGEIFVDSPEAIASLKFLKSLVAGEGDSQVGYIDTNYLSQAFGADRMGMFISSTASFTFNDQAVGNKFVWNAYPVPKRDGDTDGKTLMQGTSLGIFSHLPPEQKKGAWEFLKFATNPEMTAYWAMKTGYMPVRRSASDLPEMKKYLESNVRYANAVSSLEHASFEPRKMYWETVRLVLSRQVEAFLLNRKTAEEAMRDARAAIEQVQNQSD